jgi:hypothetical protein
MLIDIPFAGRRLLLSETLANKGTKAFYTLRYLPAIAGYEAWETRRSLNKKGGASLLPGR